jgi:hypothetical protein
MNNKTIKILKKEIQKKKRNNILKTLAHSIEYGVSL